MSIPLPERDESLHRYGCDDPDCRRCTLATREDFEKEAYGRCATCGGLAHLIKAECWPCAVDRVEEQKNRQISPLRDAVNAECECGGRGPNDPERCPACGVWHRMMGQTQ